ncbi:hypothetical protein CDL15_Pgr017295 [Punica granatum]|nr:hypothetical protein CDL15_Pgr017295 [Punica granatum]
MPSTEIHFSLWNNANVERFNESRRAQEEIEDGIRRERCCDSATRIAQIDDPAAAQPSSDATFRSADTTSSPSSPSIPGRKSKYSKPHPAFKKISRVHKTHIAAGEEGVELHDIINSHVAGSASHSLDLDLSRRFQALKSPPLAPSLSLPKPSPPLHQVDDKLKAVVGDDLSARFTALRGSLHPSSSPSFSPSVASANLVPSGTSLACNGRDRDPSCSNPDDEEDEVEKII